MKQTKIETLKTVLAIRNASDQGKTETLREFANLLLETYPNFTAIFPISATVPVTGDFRLVVQINGKIIGVESESEGGGPDTKLQNRLLVLVDKFKCEIILCSSRTKGQTIVAVDNLYNTRGFQTIWTSTYKIAGKSEQIVANKMKAKHILDLLQTLRHI